MRIVVSGSAGTVTAEDANNLDALSVTVVDAEPEQVPALLARLGRVEGEHAWLDVRSLRAFAPIPRPCSWDVRFADSVAHAASRGWLDESGKAVRAHIEPPVLVRRTQRSSGGPAGA